MQSFFGFLIKKGEGMLENIVIKGAKQNNLKNADTKKM